jgi:hypothetical protein
MIEHPNYQKLPPSAKVLILLLQTQYDNSSTKLVAYGVREAAKRIPCSKDTATKAFKILQECGFIECKEQSLFNSRTGSKTREWRLTWMPWRGKEPSHEWEQNNFTVIKSGTQKLNQPS